MAANKGLADIRIKHNHIEQPPPHKTHRFTAGPDSQGFYCFEFIRCQIIDVGLA